MMRLQDEPYEYRDHQRHDPGRGVWRRPDAGYTLIEILVSLALLALLLALMPATLRMARQSWQADAQLERSASLATATDTLRRALAATIPAPIGRSGTAATTLLFEGRGETLSFVAPAPQGLNSGGLQVFSIASRPRTGGRPGRDLVLALRPYALGESIDRSADRAAQDGQATANSNRSGSETILAEDIGTLEFRYFGQAPAQSVEVWSSTWANRPTLPLLVEVAFTLAGSTRAPERIVIAPRLAQSP